MARYCVALISDCRTRKISQQIKYKTAHTAAFTALQDIQFVLTRLYCYIRTEGQKNGAIVKDLDRYGKAPRKENEDCFVTQCIR
jgi:hypothetical protein